MKAVKIIVALTAVIAVAAGVAYAVSKYLPERKKYVAVVGDGVDEVIPE